MAASDIQLTTTCNVTSHIRNPKDSQSRLKLFNSFSKSKELFSPRGDVINWYNCGPTVYDISHMGHARCYISFDIIRRVLQNYFGFRINFVQNITDIDDKIIKRARQNYLWNQYLSELKMKGTDTQLLNDAFALFQQKIEKEEDAAKKKMLENQLKEAQSYHKTVEEIEKHCQNVLVELLDKQRGAQVTDTSIFTVLAKEFEIDYFQDMDALNILRPDHIPRVSEFVPQIVEFIKKIIENGFAYESNGSVYFDTIAFNLNEKHKYGKLAPEAIGNMSALNEGEGDLSASEDKMREKRYANDFALWKNSKPGEPSWNSPWGYGRPGWHIECSAMACNIMGEFADIHSGGVDLRFPHHENEIAQTEAYFNTGKNWINYFLHTGHLHIEGCKMSKSLKNFISIKEALQKHSARQIRLAFLMHSWEDPLDYSKKTMQEALSYEKSFKEFFFLIENYFAAADYSPATDSCSLQQTSEEQLHKQFEEIVVAIDDALCDNINSKQVLFKIRELIGIFSVYINSTEPSKADLKLIEVSAKYVTQMLQVFGLVSEKVTIGLGVQSIVIGSELSKKAIIMPYVKALCDFREKVRTVAKTLKNGELLSLCDDLRDQVLPILGIQIDDKEQSGGGFQTAIKIDEEQLAKDEYTIRKEQEERRLEKERKQHEKAAKKAELELQQLEKERLKSIPPSQLFLKETDKYSKFDEDGLPTHDQSGKEISKGQQKKLQKLHQQQQKKYSEWLAAQTSSN